MFFVVKMFYSFRVNEGQPDLRDQLLLRPDPFYQAVKEIEGLQVQQEKKCANNYCFSEKLCVDLFLNFQGEPGAKGAQVRLTLNFNFPHLSLLLIPNFLYPAEIKVSFRVNVAELVQLVDLGHQENE